MTLNSHGAKFSSSGSFRAVPNDLPSDRPHYAKMPRKSAKSRGIKPETPDWYLADWMKTLNVSQAKLAKECDWTPSTMHGIFHGRTSYYREIVNLIASKLNIEPFELLMPPDRAMALRRFQAAAVTLAHDAEQAPEPDRTMRVIKIGGF